MKPVSVITTIFLVLVATLHLLRLFFKIEVIVAGNVLPMWVSIFGCFFPAGLAILLWRESRA
jgi:Na+/proline symporter